MTNPTSDRLREIRERANAATPGPWECTLPDDQGWIVVSTDGTRTIEAWLGVNCDKSDGVFIASARADVPFLCDEVERLRGELAAEREASATVSKDMTVVCEDNDRLESANKELGERLDGLRFEISERDLAKCREVAASKFLIWRADFSPSGCRRVLAALGEPVPPEPSPPSVPPVPMRVREIETGKEAWAFTDADNFWLKFDDPDHALGWVWRHGNHVELL